MGERLKTTPVKAGVQEYIGYEQGNPNAEEEREVSRFINSDATMAWVNSLQDRDNKKYSNIRNCAVGFLIKYAMLFGGDNVEIGEITVNNEGVDKAQTILNKCCQLLGIEDAETEESRRKIYVYIVENDLNNRYFYHSFNGVFESSIRQNGLSSNKRLWDQTELNEIHEILASGGNKMGLGWNKINSESGVFVGDDTDNIYGYGVASPEWFAQFCAEGFLTPNEPARKTAFYRRDYATARKNVEDLCGSMMNRSEADIIAKKAYPNISEQDKLRVLEFFEKHWGILAGKDSSPKVAIVKRKVLKKPPPTYEEFISHDNFRNKSTKGIVEFLLGVGSNNDLKLESDVQPNDVVIVDLPDYNIVHPSLPEEEVLPQQY